MKLTMQYDATGLANTERAEGLRLSAYKDSGGVWTCGYGHTLNVSPSTICTPALAEEWLQQDIQTAVNAVNQLVEVDLTQPEFDALVDFVYNIGATQFSKSTMLDLLNQGNYEQAALQFHRWDLCDGTIVAGLLNRRNAEEQEFES